MIILLWLVGLGVAFLLPVLAPDQPYLLQTLTLALCAMIPAIGLNLLFGYTGLLSLGHMGFAGIGAYTAALLMKQAGLAFLPSIAAAALAAGSVGLLAGLPCLRLRSHFFIIVTLGAGLILSAAFNNLDGLTGGPAGLPGIPRPRPFTLLGMTVEFRSLAGFYRLTLLMTLLVLGLQWAIMRSDFGRALRAIRQDETMAASRGVNVFAHKLAVFALSAAIAGIGGAMQVLLLRVAAPSSFDLEASFHLVAILIIGGTGTLAGPIAGALIFVGVPEALRLADQWRMVLFGAVLVALALYAPRGLMGVLSRRRRAP
jgi:branched-chain amino acid transport system permease protein